MQMITLRISHVKLCSGSSLPWHRVRNFFTACMLQNTCSAFSVSDSIVIEFILVCMLITVNQIFINISLTLSLRYCIIEYWAALVTFLKKFVIIFGMRDLEISTEANKFMYIVRISVKKKKMFHVTCSRCN